MKLILTFLFVATFQFIASADTLTVSMDTIVGLNDGQVEVSITANGFTELAVFEGTIQWDNSGLDFIEVRDFGVDKLAEENFGRPNGTDDKLTFSWTEASASGASVSDGTVLFKILFQVVGSGGDTAFVNFADDPLDVSASDKVLESVFVEENNGAVLILTPLGVTAEVTDVTCSGGNDGSITLTAFGAEGEYSYLWNTGSDSAAITDISAGTYSFTLTDDVNGQEIIDSISIISPDEIVIDLQDVTAENDTLGSITLDVTGGIGPYIYSWSPEITIDSGLENGIYYLTVSDQNNCTASDSIEINVQLPSSLAEIMQYDIKAFPNPTSDRVTLIIEDGSISNKWTLYSSLGQQIDVRIVNQSQQSVTITLAGNSPGFYYFKSENYTIPILLIE